MNLFGALVTALEELGNSREQAKKIAGVGWADLPLSAKLIPDGKERETIDRIKEVLCLSEREQELLEARCNDLMKKEARNN